MGLQAGQQVNYVTPDGENQKTFEIDEQAANVMGFHPASDASRPLHQEARQHFIWLASWVKANVPAGREQSLAFTHLQTALMFVNAGVAINLAPLGDD